MRVLALDLLAEQLLTSSRSRELTPAHIVQLRDAVLFAAVLEILEGLGGALSRVAAGKLRQRVGDGTRLRDDTEAAASLDKDTAALIRQASAVYPTHFTLQCIYATRVVEVLVRRVSGADDDYVPPSCLLDVLCVVTALAVRGPQQAEFTAGQDLVRRVWAEAEATAQSLRA